MKIVIDISEDVYTRLFDNGIQDNEIAVNNVCEMARAIRLGILLSSSEKSSKLAPEDVLNHLIGAEVLDKIRAEIEKVSFTHYFEHGEYLGEDTRQEHIVNYNAVMQIIDKYKP